MKQSITLLDVCKLPDVQIHSKNSFFKAIINQDTPQVFKMRQNIAKLSYTIKTIGVKDQQVGIISKRVPLKFKDKNQQVIQYNPQFISMKQYVPHKSFYAAALIPVKKKQKSQKKLINNQLELLNNNQFSKNQPYRIISGLRGKCQSMNRLRKINPNIKSSRQKNYQVSKKAINIQTRKSYSKILQNISKQKKISLMHPLRHQQNPLFKKIKKFNNLIKIQQTQNRSQKSVSYLANFSRNMDEEI